MSEISLDSTHGNFRGETTGQNYSLTEQHQWATERN